MSNLLCCIEDSSGQTLIKLHEQSIKAHFVRVHFQTIVVEMDSVRLIPVVYWWTAGHAMVPRKGAGERRQVESCIADFSQDLLIYCQFLVLVYKRLEGIPF